MDSFKSPTLTLKDLKPATQKRISKAFDEGTKRVIRKNPAAFEKISRSIIEKMNEGKDVTSDIVEFVELDDELAEVAQELGLVDSRNEGTKLVCLGACLFLAGMVVGTIVGVAISK